MGCAPWPRPAATPRTGGADGPPAEPERTSFGLQSYPDFIPEHPRESTPALARVGGCANPDLFLVGGLLDSAPDQTQRTQRAQREANWSIQRRYTKSKTALDVRQRLDVQEVVEPHVGQLFLDGVLPQARREVGKVDAVHLLVLVEAREDDRLLAARRVDVLLETLRADFFHHALHRRVD